MTGNYLRTAIRNLLRNKGYAFISIAGLSIGLAVSVLILLYVSHETGYDKTHQKAERIFRMNSEYHLSGLTREAATSGYTLVPLMKAEMPFVESFVRLVRAGTPLLLEKDNEQFFEENVYYTDTTYFDVFTHPFVYGNANTALSEPNSILLSRKLSEKLFGKDVNPVGETLLMGPMKQPMKITAVIENLPSNVHYRINALIPLSKVDAFLNQPLAIWSFNTHSLLLLKEGVEKSQIEEAWPAFYETHMADAGRSLQATYKVIPENLRSIHLYSRSEWDLPRGRMVYVYIFSIVAVFIIVIASINYTNMATARSEKRSREVGIRKVLGSTKAELITQFLGESLVVTCISFLLALGIIELLMPVFNNLTTNTFTSQMIFTWSNLWVFLLFIAFTSLLAGAYPAFFLSSFQAVEVLKSKATSGSPRAFLRKALLIFQFTLSMFMIMGTVMVSRQLNFIRHKDIGFQKENLMQLRLTDTALVRRAEALKGSLRQIPAVENVASASILPGAGISRNVHTMEGADGENFNQAVNFVFVDLDYFATMGIEMAQGRHFFTDSEKDLEDAFIVNQAAAKAFGWDEQAIGKKIQWGAEIEGDDEGVRRGKVIGVAKDFNYNSLHQQIDPLVILPGKRLFQYIVIRLKPGYDQASIQRIKEVFESFSTVQIFNPTFLDQNLDNLYEGEHKLSHLFVWFSGISLFISFMGLIALISFVTEKRKKEFAIRKVLGAGLTQILRLIYKEFFWLVLISFFLAAPLAWYSFNIWVANFAYSTPLSITPFLSVGLLILLLTLTTVSYHAIKTSLTNPAEVIGAE